MQKVVVLAVTGVVVMCCALGVFASGLLTGPSSPSGSPSSGASTPTSVKPTRTPLVVHYPPATQADLRGLAAKGNASAIHVASSESVGLVGVCPEPRREVWVDPELTGQPLAEDLLAFFYGQGLDSTCGSLVVAYHTQAEAVAGDYYTAGRINLDVTDSSGAANTDPNATKLTYTLTLDIGGALTGQEYVVTYS